MNVQIVKKTTMNEEKYLEERLTKHNPFQVPEGYFDSFAEQVMNQLPERQQEARRVLLRLGCMQLLVWWLQCSVLQCTSHVSVRRRMRHHRWLSLNRIWMLPLIMR